VTRVAAIDCGTNSIRLLVADLPDDGDTSPITGGGKTDLHREMRVVRLGEGVDRTGRLSAAALERTRLALVDYARTLGELGATRTRLVATSASRDADNRQDFIDLVTGVLGVPPEVVPGSEEASLSFDGATRELDQTGAPFLVADIGGGSTEVVLGSRTVEAALSVDVGCVRLTERHLHGDPPTPAEVAAARADVGAALDRVAAAVPVGTARTFVGLAGSVTTIAAVALGLPAYDAARLHLSRISAEQVREVSERLLGMTRAERAALPVMHPGRVDVIGGGALVLHSIVDRFDVREVLVSEADILDGIAWSLDPRPLSSSGAQ
jgi:exopolyphosphatase/guanosine-5'-triphosphate,3'-diphosphate pyrophosphatase